MMEVNANLGDIGSSSSAGGDLGPGPPPWKPQSLAFCGYGKSRCSVGGGGSQRSSGLGAVVNKPLVSRLTKDLVETYQACNPNFKFSEALNPKRFLTSPNIGVSNEGFDNVNSDLILSVNFVLMNRASHQRYIVKEMLGQGTFGQVAKCWVPEINDYVAVKVIKNLPAYYHQAIYEVTILRMLNQNFDRDNKHHIVRMLEFFEYRHHLCISFEMLGSNLYDLLKANQLKGLPLNVVQMFSKQILHALIVMKDAGIIHCDLKPENILLWTSITPTGVKVIDFGSACKEDQTVYSYIQSRYYRSPEVLLGHPYTTAIDMWSFGCIVAELFLGLPLFPGASEYDLLKRMIKIIGGQPPDFVLRAAKKTAKFFKHVGSIHQVDHKQAFHPSTCAYRLLTEEEYEARDQKKPVLGKWYFNHVKLEDIVAGYPYRRNLAEEEKSKERLVRLALVDFVRGLIEFDPEKRWTPLQASGHPFVTGQPFTKPYCPPPVTPHSPIIPNIRVDHGPDRGHWLATGLSPQVPNMNRGVRHSSPCFQIMPLSHGGSYGSWGSYGSYNDNPGLVGSYGSYGDNSSIHDYYRSGGSTGLSIPIRMGGSTLGASPETRVLPHQFSYGTGYGMSSTGTFRPMSLGVSPSQFTPPSSQIQVSNNSPGKYGPTSPAKGTSYGSPLGKAAAVGQYNKKRNWGHPGSGSISVQHLEGVSQHRQGHPSDGSFSEQKPQGLVHSPRSAQQSSWKNDRSDSFPSGINVPVHNNIRSLHPGNTRDTLLFSESSSSQPECSTSPLDPGDWDPTYSDDLLLQEEGSDANNLISGMHSMHLAPQMKAAVLGIESSGHGHCHMLAHPTNPVSSNIRTDGQIPMYSHARTSQSSAYDINSGYSRPAYLPQQNHMLHFSQGSPSRFAQQPVQFHQMQSHLVHGERNCHKMQSMRPGYNSEDPHYPANGASASGTAWGHQGGHPIAAVLPSYHSRGDYGRIS